MFTHKEAQQTPSRLNTKKKKSHLGTSQSNCWKPKIKRKALKAARGGKKAIYRRTIIQITANFSSETIETRRSWTAIFKITKGKNPLTIQNHINN